MNVPNLDGTWAPELRQYANKLSRRRRRMSEARRAVLGAVYDRLILYARTKADAMEARSKGELPVALHLEGICDRIYQLLPRKARW